MMGWHGEVLDASARQAAARLGEALGPTFYLAGGTALALRLGHRISLDLDLFSAGNRLDEPGRVLLVDHLRSTGRTEVMDVGPGTLHLSLGPTPVSLFHYPYRLLKPADTWEGLRVCSIEDIAAMMISAILGRGSRRDFIDLYAASRKVPLEKLIRAAERKFADHPDIAFTAYRALVYFADAEKEPMPRLKEALSWGRIKSFFESEVPRLVGRRLY